MEVLRAMVTKERAIYKPQCDICNSPVASKRYFEHWRDCTCKEGKLLRDRKNEDERQTRLERSNKLKATDLEARELAQKEKTMERRETRQAAGLTFADFGQEVTLLDVATAAIGVCARRRGNVAV